MELKKWLEKWNLTSLKVNANFLELELNFTDTDKKAAWEMYIELLTRTTTQHLHPGDGDEKTTLDSIHSLFSTTREILKNYGSSCVEFTKISVIILNQVVRPFASKWHKKSLEGAFEKTEECQEFRKELIDLQEKIRNYTKLLSEIAGVEDLTEMEA